MHIHTHTVRRPTIDLTAPPAALLNQEITITCTAAVNATIMLMVVNSAGMNVALTEVETTGDSRIANLTVTSLGQHNVTCVADNQGLTEMETAQFDGISELGQEHSYMTLHVTLCFSHPSPSPQYPSGMLKYFVAI